MGSEFSVLIEQIEILATLIVIGLCWQKARLFNDELINSLSAIIAKLILPLMLCTIIGSAPRDSISDGIRFFIAAAVIYSSTVLIAILCKRFLKIPEPNRSMFVLLQCYGNSGFIGIPMITSIFPQEAGIASAAYLLIDSSFYWVLGPYIAGSGKLSFKKMISPLTIAILTGFLIMLSGIDLSGNIVWTTAKNVGGTCKYFASIYIGMAIGRMDLKKLKANLVSVIAAPVRLILIPLFAYFLLGKTGFLSRNQLTMFIILSATPAGMSLPIIAELANVDSGDFASVGVTLSTILSLATLPLIVWLISVI